MMESIAIWFATGFSFAFGCAFGFFCFKHRPTKSDNEWRQLMQDRNDLDAQKVLVLERIARCLEWRNENGGG